MTWIARQPETRPRNQTSMNFLLASNKNHQMGQIPAWTCSTCFIKSPHPRCAWDSGICWPGLSNAEAQFCNDGCGSLMHVSVALAGATDSLVCLPCTSGTYGSLSGSCLPSHKFCWAFVGCVACELMMKWAIKSWMGWMSMEWACSMMWIDDEWAIKS